MRKVFTLFCVLMAAFFSIGVANAQTTFQVSSSASEDAHWYVITLDNFIISSDALEYGNKSFGGAAAFSMSSKYIKDAIKDASLWCIVGDDTKGYKLYNKAKVNGEYQILALNNSSTTNAGAYGASRAKLVSSSTESSTADNADGCAFDIREKGASYPNIYCIRLHNTTNRYLNNRDNNLSYWQDDAAFNSASVGSQVRFYEYNKSNDYCRVGLSSLLLPGVATDNNVSAAETNFSKEMTLANIEALESAISNVLATKYYRINNQRSNGIKQLATDGSNTPQMVSSANANRLVNAIWQFTLCDDGVKMTNVNNPGKFVAVLSDANVNSSLTNPLTTQEQGIKLVFSKFNNGKFCIKDGDGHLMNGENDTKHGNYALNHWSSTQAWNNGNGTDGNQWDIVEASSIEVALHELDNKSYASVYLPFSISSVNDGVKVFVAKEPETNEVTFTETTNGVMANKGFLLISDNAAATATVNIGESNTDSRMLGTLTNLNLTNVDKSTYRVFGKNSNNEVGFFTPSGTLDEVKANRGYFKVATGGALRLNFEDSVVSGIDAIDANQALHNAPIFDLSGRRVMNTVKGGLYIQNGRKFIVK